MVGEEVVVTGTSSTTVGSNIDETKTGIPAGIYAVLGRIDVNTLGTGGAVMPDGEIGCFIAISTVSAGNNEVCTNYYKLGSFATSGATTYFQGSVVGFAKIGPAGTLYVRRAVESYGTTPAATRTHNYTLKLLRIA
jgi:hypothetical protein